MPYMGQRRSRWVSSATLIVALLLGGVLLALNFLHVYAYNPPQSAWYGWPVPYCEETNLNLRIPFARWNAANVVVNLFFTVLLTGLACAATEWLVRGHRPPHFSLLSLMVVVFAAATLMWVNTIPWPQVPVHDWSTGQLQNLPPQSGWPMVYKGRNDFGLEWLALLWNIFVGLIIALACGVICEKVLRGLEYIRETYIRPPGTASWRPFARKLNEERKRERETKIQGREGSDENPAARGS